MVQRGRRKSKSSNNGNNIKGRVHKPDRSIQAKRTGSDFSRHDENRYAPTAILDEDYSGGIFREGQQPMADNLPEEDWRHDLPGKPVDDQNALVTTDLNPFYAALEEMRERIKEAEQSLEHSQQVQQNLRQEMDNARQVAQEAEEELAAAAKKAAYLKHEAEHICSEGQVLQHQLTAEEQRWRQILDKEQQLLADTEQKLRIAEEESQRVYHAKEVAARMNERELWRLGSSKQGLWLQRRKVQGNALSMVRDKSGNWHVPKTAASPGVTYAQNVLNREQKSKQNPRDNPGSQRVKRLNMLSESAQALAGRQSGQMEEGFLEQLAAKEARRHLTAQTELLNKRKEEQKPLTRSAGETPAKMEAAQNQEMPTQTGPSTSRPNCEPPVKMEAEQVLEKTQQVTPTPAPANPTYELPTIMETAQVLEMPLQGAPAPIPPRPGYEPLVKMEAAQVLEMQQQAAPISASSRPGYEPPIILEAAQVMEMPQQAAPADQLTVDNLQLTMPITSRPDHEPPADIDAAPAEQATPVQAAFKPMQAAFKPMQAAPAQAAFEPMQTALAQVAFEQTAPVQTVPLQAELVQAVFEKAAFEQAMPEHTAPEQAAPEQDVFEQAYIPQVIAKTEVEKPDLAAPLYKLPPVYKPQINAEISQTLRQQEISEQTSSPYMPPSVYKPNINAEVSQILRNQEGPSHKASTLTPPPVYMPGLNLEPLPRQETPELKQAAPAHMPPPVYMPDINTKPLPRQEAPEHIAPPFYMPSISDMPNISQMTGDDLLAQARSDNSVPEYDLNVNVELLQSLRSQKASGKGEDDPLQFLAMQAAQGAAAVNPAINEADDASLYAEKQKQLAAVAERLQSRKQKSKQAAQAINEDDMQQLTHQANLLAQQHLARQQTPNTAPRGSAAIMQRVAEETGNQDHLLKEQQIAERAIAAAMAAAKKAAQSAMAISGQVNRQATTHSTEQLIAAALSKASEPSKLRQNSDLF